jgi:hypothetical protein
MWLRKEQGGTSIGPHDWPEDGSVTEVPDHFGRTLLAIPGGGFTEVAEPEADGDEDDSQDPDGDGQDDDADGDGETTGDGNPDSGLDEPKPSRQRKQAAKTQA